MREVIDFAQGNISICFQKYEKLYLGCYEITLETHIQQRTCTSFDTHGIYRIDCSQRIEKKLNNS